MIQPTRLSAFRGVSIRARPGISKTAPRAWENCATRTGALSGALLSCTLSATLTFVFPHPYTTVSDHNRFSSPSDSLPLPMAGRVTKNTSTVPVLLSTARILVINTALNLLGSAYEDWKIALVGGTGPESAARAMIKQ